MIRFHLRWRRAQAAPGFTLVEVTLALAAAVIALVALLGVLVVANDAARWAADVTIAASLAQDIFQDVRSQPFTNVVITGSARNLRTFSGVDGELYYDGDGFDAPPARARFKCRISYEPDPARSALTRAQVLVIWPALVVAPPNTNLFVTRIAQVD
jgi:uncharacterized protein (TIGR02598 family)